MSIIVQCSVNYKYIRVLLAFASLLLRNTFFRYIDLNGADWVNFQHYEYWCWMFNGYIRIRLSWTRTDNKTIFLRWKKMRAKYPGFPLSLTVFHLTTEMNTHHHPPESWKGGEWQQIMSKNGKRFYFIVLCVEEGDNV